MGRTNRPALVALVAIAAGLLVFCNRPPKYPELPPAPVPDQVRQLFDAKDGVAIDALGRRKVTENLGRPFPEITIRDGAGALHSSREFDGKRTAIFIAGGCAHTSAWLAKLRDASWKMPGLEYDRLVFFVLTPDHHQPITAAFDVFDIGWPMPGFLAYEVGYPVVYVVAPDGTFEGCQRTFGGPVERAETPRI